MKFIFKPLLVLLLASAGLSTVAQVPAEKVPDFNFFRLNKSLFTNNDLEQGKMLFFIFFDADCDHCQRAMQYLNQHHNDFKKTAVYLITMDDQEKITRFMNTYGSNFKSKKNVTILQDTKYEFINKFKPRKYPSLFLYSKDKELLIYEDNEKNLSRFSKQISAT